jgi:hypothetical protein
MTTTTPLTVPKLHLGLPPEERLAHLVLNSERLLQALPADKLADLFHAFEAATEAVREARRLPIEPDIAAEVDAALKAREPIDPAALVKRVAAVADAHLRTGHGDRQYVATSSPRDHVITVLGEAVVTVTDRIVSLVGDHTGDYFAALSNDLTVLMDQAEPVADVLTGVSSPEAAIRAKRADDWAQLLELTSEYAALRTEQRTLLGYTSEIPANVGDGTAGLLRSYFAGMSNLWPNFDLHVRGSSSLPQVVHTDVMGRETPGRSQAPFPVFDVSSPLHLLAVVRSRDLLLPHVGQGSAAVL